MSSLKNRRSIIIHLNLVSSAENNQYRHQLNSKNMDYSKCTECGKETPIAVSRCVHCGAKMPQVSNTETISDNQIKERAGFTTFWLWLCMVVSAVMGIASFVGLFTGLGPLTAHDPMFIRIFGFVLVWIIFYGYWSLLRWKKRGFTTLSVMAGINFVIILIGSMVTGTLSFSVFTPIFSILILYVVLQIRKNGKSCWEQLS